MSRLQSGHYDGESPGNFPFLAAGTMKELYPSVCLRSHWDATAMLKLILPSQHVELPQDFRPYVKVCKDYVTSGPAIPAPLPPKNMVFPMGGEFYPPGRYAAAIDDESKLFYLDRTLDRYCQTHEYIPPRNSDMYVPNVMVTRTVKPTSDFVQELAMPQAVLRETGYNCRTENDQANWNRSPRLFSNPTKQDRYGAQTFYALPGGVLTFPHGGVEKVPLTNQAAAGAQLVGSMKQFGASGAGLPPRMYVDAKGNQVDANGKPLFLDASGNRLVDSQGNLLVDVSGNIVGEFAKRISIGSTEMPGGPAPLSPGHIRPKYAVRPDRNLPIRIAGVTEGSYAPA
jgi:hypothetical protein